MNSFQSISGDSENSSVTRRGVSRRSVMKAGAAAAWSVPLVQVVAAAPAVACSGTTAEVTGTATRAAGAITPLATTVFVTNNSANMTTGVVVTLTFPGGSYKPVPTSPGQGWTVTSNNTSATFTNNTFQVSACGGQQSFTSSIGISAQKRTPFAISLTATVGGITASAGSIAVS